MNYFEAIVNAYESLNINTDQKIEISADTMFVKNLGFDSITFIAFIIKLEPLVKIDLSAHTNKMIEIMTIGDAVKYLESINA